MALLDNLFSSSPNNDPAEDQDKRAALEELIARLARAGAPDNDPGQPPLDIASMTYTTPSRRGVIPRPIPFDVPPTSETPLKISPAPPTPPPAATPAPTAPPLETMSVRERPVAGTPYEAPPAPAPTVAGWSATATPAAPAPAAPTPTAGPMTAPGTKGGGPTDRTPTIWDRMSALGRGYASGGLVGAIGDAGNIDRAFDDRNATVKAIADKINDPQLARVIAADPELLKVVMTNVLTPKAGSWEKIEYTDEAGRPAVGLYNKTSPNAGIIRVGSGKSDMPADLVTKLAQVRTSIEALKRARPVFDREFSASDAAQLAASNTPAGDISAVSGDIGRARRDMMQSAEGAIRIASGAAVPETEMARYVQMYVPTVTDTLASRKQKMDNLSTFLDELATAIQTKGRVLSAQEVADIHARSAARASGAPSPSAPAAGGTPGRPDPLGLRR